MSCLLKNITDHIPCDAIAGGTNVMVSAVVSDSRKIQPGALFVAVKGLHYDGHDFIEMAIEKGATSIICENLPGETPPGVSFIKTPDSAHALGMASGIFFGNPSHHVKLVGITGTNGKTSTATLLYEAFRDLGYKTGLISTVRILSDNEEIESTHTTPDPITLNALLKKMLDMNCSHVFMEVSSHAVVQKRIAGLRFSGGVFTNITHDHLDYHQSFRNYLYAKKAFFDALPKDAFALLNADDKNAGIMGQNTRAVKKYYSLRTAADFNARIIETGLDGMQLSIDGTEVWTKITGRFNAYNILASYAAAVLLGNDKERILQSLSRQHPVEGRFDTIYSPNGITAVVDYAHTPDALDNVLRTISQINRENGGVITVLGCGGDRDKAKRPLMAAIAAAYSQRLILTSDNPRSENPSEIIVEMKQGLDDSGLIKCLSITEREEAIRTAVMMARPGDVILVAGKGHEKYQEIMGKKHPFDDKEVINRLFESLKRQ